MRFSLLRAILRTATDKGVRLRRAGLALLTTGAFAFSGAAYAQNADIVLNHTFAPISGPAGGQFTATSVIANTLSSDPAENVTLTVQPPTTPPGGVVILGAYTPAEPTTTCSDSAQTVTCTLGTLAPGDSRTVTVVYTLTSAVGSWPSTATITSTTPDPDTSNNTETEAVTTVAASDVGITFLPPDPTIPPQPLVSGEDFSYMLQVANNGPIPIAAGDRVVMQFTVPDKVHMTGWTSAYWDEWNCSPRTADAGVQVTCVNANGLGVNQTNNLSINAVAMGATASAVDTTFGVTAESGATGQPIADTNSTNDTVTIPVEFTVGSDVSIDKSASLSGGDATFTLRPRLEGGDPLQGVPITITDTYDANELTFGAWTATNGWTCTPPTPGAGTQMTLTCTLPEYTGANFSDMPVLTYTVTPNNPGPGAVATNTATISLGGRPDPITANNTASVTIDDGTSDMTARKQVNFSPTVVNQPFQFLLHARNNGPWGIPAGQTITLTDTLPENMTLNAAPTGTGWTCTVLQNGAPVGYPVTSTGVAPVDITCTRADGLASNTNSANVELNVQTATAGNFANRTCVALASGAPGDRVDTNSANDCSDFYPGDGNVVTTTQQADLEISKVPSPASVLAGEPLTYTLTVINNGPDPATDITVSDTLNPLINQDGLQSVTITTQPLTSAPGTCSVDSTANPVYPLNGTAHTVHCGFPQMLVGETATIEIVILPNIPLTGTRPNIATIYSSAVGDPDRSNNFAFAGSEVVGVFDLSASSFASTASASPATTAAAGSLVTFTNRISSNGPSTSPTATMTIQLPPNAEFESLVTTGGGNCTPPPAGTIGGTLVCNWPGGIPANAVRDVSYRVWATPAQAGDTVNNAVDVALITPGTPRPETDLANNSATAQVTITPAISDMEVAIGDGPDPIALGAQSTITLTVLNGGPSIATDVVLNTTFAPGSAVFSYQGGLTVGAGGTCTEPALGATSGTISCTWPSMTPNTPVTVTYLVQSEAVNSGAISGTITTYTAVASNEQDPTPGNNTANETTTTDRQPPVGTQPADLGVVKTASVTTIAPGVPFDYTLTVTNNGPGPLTPVFGAQVIDVLPPQLTLTATPTGCNYDDPTRTLSCRIENLAVNATAAITVPVVANDVITAGLANTATIDLPTDPNPGNDTSTVTLQPQPIDLTLAKTASVTAIQPGAPFDYTLTVTNNGPAALTAAYNAQVVDVLPAGLTLSSVPAGCSYAAATRTLSCPITTLAVGGNTAFTVPVTADPTLSAAVTNSATVSVPNDPNPGDNTSTITLQPIPIDLSVVKTASVTEILGGESFNYTLTVTNNGPGNVIPEMGAALVDRLPPQLTLVSGTPAGCSYNAASRELRCPIDNLASGATYTETLTVTVNTTNRSDIANTATVSVPFDPDPGNNTSTTTVRAILIDLAMVKEASVTDVDDGDPFTYTLTVTNNGPDALTAAMGAELVDTLPPGLIFNSAPGCTYDAPTRMLTCPLGPLAAGATQVITLNVTVDPPYGANPISNQAQVLFPPDTTPGNNTSRVTVNAHIRIDIPTLPQWALLLLMLAVAVSAAKSRSRRR